MKTVKLTLLAWLTLLTGGVSAQRTTVETTTGTIPVTILEDAPEKAHTSYLAIDVMAADFDFDLRGASMYIGVSGRKEFGKFAVEGCFQPNYLNLGGKGFGLHTEGGIFFPLSTKKKVKDVPVVLKYDPYAGETWDGRRVESTNYVKVPGTYINTFGVRGGAYFKKSGYESDDIWSTESSMLLTGIYAGFQKNSQALVKTLIDNKEERTGAGFARIYADFLFLPIHTIADPALLTAAEGNRIWGARCGLSWYLDPHDSKYKRLGRSIITAELGTRPFTGFFVNMAWSFAILHW